MGANLGSGARARKSAPEAFRNANCFKIMGPYFCAVEGAEHLSLTNPIGMAGTLCNIQNGGFNAGWQSLAPVTPHSRYRFGHSSWVLAGSFVAGAYRVQGGMEDVWTHCWPSCSRLCSIGPTARCPVGEGIGESTAACAGWTVRGLEPLPEGRRLKWRRGRHPWAALPCVPSPSIRKIQKVCLYPCDFVCVSVYAKCSTSFDMLVAVMNCMEGGKALASPRASSPQRRPEGDDVRQE